MRKFQKFLVDVNGGRKYSPGFGDGLGMKNESHREEDDAMIGSFNPTLQLLVKNEEALI